MSEDPGLDSLGSLPPFSKLTKDGRLSSEHPAILPPAQPGFVGRLGSYNLIRLLGQGGMGLVYLACAVGSRELVAIKILRIELMRHPRWLAFFLKEGRHGLKLNHPHVLRVLECSREPAFLVMPYMERGSLNTWLKTKPELSEKAIAVLGQQIASGVGFAHKKGLIHRDLKPSNILLDDQGQAYVADFGLALSLFNDSLIDAGASSVEGTPYYMSPAVAAGEIEDTRCDIYSFGAVLYELLTGKPPYHGLMARDVLQQIRQGPPHPILELNPNASPVLARIAEKAMARSLSERYAHMDYVEADLTRVIAGKGEQLVLGSEKTADRSRFPWTPFLWGVLALACVIGLGWWFIPRSGIGLERARKAAVPASASQPLPTEAQSPLRLVKAIQLPGIWHWLNGRAADYNGKPPMELFVQREGNLAIVSLEGEVLREWKPRAPGTMERDMMILLGQADFDGDQRLDHLVSWGAFSNLFLSIYNDNDFEINRMNLPGSLWQTKTGTLPGSGIAAGEIADLDQDGHPDVLVQVVSGYAKEPRSLVAINPVAGREKWRFDLAPNPHSVVLGDLDGDQRLEVLLGSYAVSNGKTRADGTDDDHSYLFCLDSAGRLLWRHEMGRTYSSCYAAVVTPKKGGPPSIVGFMKSVWDYRNSVGPYPQLTLFTPEGEVVRQFGGTNISAPSWLVADLDSDQETEVYMTDCDGHLYGLGSDLALKKRIQVVPKQYTWVRLELWGVEDMDGDGRKELIASSSQVEFISGTNPGKPEGEATVRRFHDNQILLLDSEFNCLAHYQIAKAWDSMSELRVQVADLRGIGGKDIVVFADKAYWLTYTYRSGTKPRQPPSDSAWQGSTRP